MSKCQQVRWCYRWHSDNFESSDPRSVCQNQDARTILCIKFGDQRFIHFSLIAQKDIGLSIDRTDNDKQVTYPQSTTWLLKVKALICLIYIRSPSSFKHRFLHLILCTPIMRPSSLGGGRILRRTLSVCLSVRLSVCLSVRPVRGSSFVILQ